MRLSRNRGNARGPTRLTNPLHRATSCRTRAFVRSLARWFTRSLARSLARLATKPSLTIFFLPLPSLKRNTLRLSRHSTHILLLPAIFLPPSCLPPACLLHSPSVLPPCSMHSFHLSLFHNPPTTVFIFRYSFFPVLSFSSVILPMSTSLRSSISSPCSHRIPSLPTREVHPPVSAAYFFVCEHYRPSSSVVHARLGCSCHLCYRITPGLFRSLNSRTCISQEIRYKSKNTIILFSRKNKI